jgi:MGT family glycosyltransferase
MPTALFFNVPGHGHVAPSLPLVAELTRRGHDITYHTSEGFRAAVEATGAAFQSYRTVDDDYFTSRDLHGGRPQKVALELLTTAEAILPEFLASAASAPPDYILFDGMCPWGYLAAHALRVPAVASLALAPPVSPPSLAMLKLLPVFAPLALRDPRAGAQAKQLGRALASRYGAPPPANFGSLLSCQGDISISYTSSAFQPFADTVPASVRFIGWTMQDAPGGADGFSFEPLQGRSLIYVSLGTVNNDNSAFFRTCLAAFAGADEFVIMSTGGRIAPESLGVLPENMAIHSWVPQSQVLRQAALFITHGGLNSIHDGLTLGLPLLLIPQQEEQTFNAMRVVELGAGLMLKPRQVSGERLRASARRLLAEPQFALESRRIGDTLRAAGGAPKAVDEIELLLAEKSGS